MMTQKDEIDKDKHLNMVLVEFIEAIGRVAEKLFLPPVFENMQGVSEEINNLSGGMSESNRNIYSKLPLYVKIETLIMMMVSATQKKEYVDKLYAKMSKFHWTQSLADKKTHFVAVEKPYESKIQLPSNIEIKVKEDEDESDV